MALRRKPVLLAAVTFGSLLAYSPRGRSELAERSRERRDRAKAGDQRFFATRAKKLVALKPECIALFGSNVTLIPMPRSDHRDQHQLWPALNLCRALLAEGLGGRLLPLVIRVRPVRKSATSGFGQRPTPQAHLESFELRNEQGSTPTRIVVVDDIVTKGATILAAASLLKHQFPRASVQAFALIRTRGFGVFARILDPCLGEIVRTSWGGANRIDSL